MSWRRLGFAFGCLVLSCSIWGGCAFKVNKEEVPIRSYVIFDSDRGVVPQPNKLVIDSLAATLAANPSAYDPAFSDLIQNYLTKTGGFDPYAPLDFTVKGKIDTATLTAENFRILDISLLMAELQKPAPDLNQILVTRLGEPELVSSSYDDAKNETHVLLRPPNDALRPDDGFVHGHHYLVIVTRNVKAPDGTPVIGDQAFNFLKAVTPLVVNGVSQVSSLVPLELAKSLEVARSQLFKPVLDYLESSAAATETLKRTEYGAFWYFNVRSSGAARLELASSDIPTPNDILINPQTKLLSFPYCDADCASDEICQMKSGVATCVKTADTCSPACSDGFSCVDGACVANGKADIHAFSYLNTLDGFSAVGALTVRFDMAIDTTTIEGNFSVYDVTDPNAPKKVEGFLWAYDAPYRALSLVPSAPLTAAHRYIILFTNGVKGENGQPLVASLNMALLRLKDPLSKTTNGKVEATIPSIPDDTETDLANLATLEGLRTLHNTYLSALETAGFLTDRTTLISFWLFTIGDYFEAQFNPAVPSPALNPFPNDTLIDQTANLENGDPNPHFGKVLLPVTGSETQQRIVNALNELNGFSPLQPTTVPLSHELDTATIKNWTGTLPDFESSLFMVDIGAVGQISIAPIADLVDVTFDKTTLQLSITPKPGMSFTPGHRYLIALTNDLKSKTGKTLMAAPTFHLIRGTDKLYNSELDVSLTKLVENPATAARLELLRSAYESQIFALFGDKGISRERAVLIWTFTVQTIADEMQALRKYIFDTWSDAQITATGTLKNPGEVTELANVPTSSLGKVVVDGVLSTLQLVGTYDATNGSQAFMKDTDGSFKSRTENLEYVVALPSGTGPFPVVVFAHGFGGTKMDAFKVANELAKKGFATIAVDLPYFGSRTPSGQQNGAAFLNAKNAPAIRDALRQAALDQIQLIRSLEKINSALGGGQLKTDEKPFLLATSLGAMAGTLTCAVESNLGGCALNNTAGHFSRLLTSTSDTSLLAPFLGVLQSEGITPGSLEYAQLLTFVQTILDRGDAMNFARHLIKEPLDDLVAGTKLTAKPVLIQLGKADTVVSNALTTDFFNAVKKDGTLAKLTEYTNGCHTFLTDPAGCPTDATSDQTTALGEIGDFFNAQRK
ncbi:MAG: alpha/beta fold hydrolase [Myxococcales bacterium]|nr:alpha/beta fold hydrolase [Myxococcales bacterium]